MNKGILYDIQKYAANKKKMVSVLIDPDNRNFGQLTELLTLCNLKVIDFLLVGGSILGDGNIEETTEFIKERSQIPVIIFPGTVQQISNKADGILLLSLVSGRNADLLIGKHVESSFKLKSSGLEVMPTGYMLVDSGKQTTASYISFTHPLPADKHMLAAATALAAEQLGMKLLYLDGGSGAGNNIGADVIKKVKEHTSLPLIVGGGIKTRESIAAAFEAGADMVVIGTALENNPQLLNELI
jgi:putative glycerol-1-phosphate prenyltransferase